MYGSQVAESSISMLTNSQPPQASETGVVEPPIFLLGQLDTLEKLAAQLTRTLTLTQEHTNLFFETASEETSTDKAVLANTPPSERLKILVETISLCRDIAESNRQAISRIF